MNTKGIGNCLHEVCQVDDILLLFNDEDSHFATEFNTYAEVEKFTNEMLDLARKVFA